METRPGVYVGLFVASFSLVISSAVLSQKINTLKLVSKKEEARILEVVSWFGSILLGVIVCNLVELSVK